MPLRDSIIEDIESKLGSQYSICLPHGLTIAVGYAGDLTLAYAKNVLCSVAPDARQRFYETIDSDNGVWYPYFNPSDNLQHVVDGPPVVSPVMIGIQRELAGLCKSVIVLCGACRVNQSWHSYSVDNLLILPLSGAAALANIIRTVHQTPFSNSFTRFGHLPTFLSLEHDLLDSVLIKSHPIAVSTGSQTRHLLNKISLSDPNCLSILTALLPKKHLRSEVTVHAIN